MTIEIRNDIPFPVVKGRSNVKIYPWKTLNVGESFLMPGVLKTPQSQVWMANKLHSPRVFKGAVTEEGYRIWRVQ